MPNKVQGKTKTISEILLWTGIVIAFGLIAYTNLFRYCYKMNSDIAAEAVLARLIWDSKEWVPESWYASTELRLFGTPNLASVFYGMTGNMSLAMGIASTLMTFGIGASGYFFVKQCELKTDSRLLFLLLCFLLPNHFVTLELMYLWAGYYSIHVIVLFITLGVYVRLLKGKRLLHGEVFLQLLPIGFSFCMGLQGTRSILILSGPLFCVEALRISCKRLCKTAEKKDVSAFLWAFGVLAAGALGTRNGLSVGQDFSRNIRKGMSKLFEVVLPETAECIGLQEGIGLAKILLWFCVLILIVDFIRLIGKLCRKTELSTEEWVQLFLVVSPVMTMIFVAFTTIESSERYYFIFLYAIAFAVIRLWNGSNVLLQKLIGGGLVVLLLANSFSVYQPIISENDRISDERLEVIEYLERNGCKAAYASFESANSMTVLANGSVRVAAVASVKGMDMCKWLSSTEWYGPNTSFQEKTAYIVTEAEQEAFAVFLQEHGEELQYEMQIGKYLIYMSDYNFSNIE